MNSILREAEHTALSDITLSGKVLDLGGSKKSEYQKIFKGDYTLTTVNLDTKADPDICHDLENPLPFESETYDAVLLINVLEHVYHARELLAESARVLKQGGTLVVVVPFLFPVHPSPDDFWRFTESALRRMLAECGLKEITITPLGTGVCAARALFIERLLPSPIAYICTFFRPLVYFADYFVATVARTLGKKYSPADYPLGFAVVANK